MWNELYWQTVSPLFVALLGNISVDRRIFKVKCRILESLHLVYFEELVVSVNVS